jgi:hypothetical protein
MMRIAETGWRTINRLVENVVPDRCKRGLRHLRVDVARWEGEEAASARVFKGDLILLAECRPELAQEKAVALTHRLAVLGNEALVLKMDGEAPDLLAEAIDLVEEEDPRGVGCCMSRTKKSNAHRAVAA